MHPVSPERENQQHERTPMAHPHHIERRKRQKMTYLETLKQKTKEQLINDLYNNKVESFADYDERREEMLDKHGHGKRIPYIGWYWRNLDFIGKNITIGDCCDFVGVMEKNKWGYAQRKMAHNEVDAFILYLEHAFVASDKEAVCHEIWDWFQTLRDTGQWCED